MGQRAASFRTNGVSSGWRDLEIVLADHASSVYLYHVRVNGLVSEMKKMLLAK